MNLVLGGTLIALSTRLTGGHRDACARRALPAFTAALPTLMAATITFGVAPLLFLQVLYGRAFFASAVLMAWLWLAVIPLLLCGYYAAYRAAHHASVPRRGAAAGDRHGRRPGHQPRSTATTCR